MLASAVGPLLLARCVAATGSYASAFYLLAVVVAVLGIAAAAVPAAAGCRPGVKDFTHTDTIARPLRFHC